MKIEHIKFDPNGNPYLDIVNNREAYPLLSSWIERSWSEIDLMRLRFLYGAHWPELEATKLSDDEARLVAYLNPEPVIEDIDLDKDLLRKIREIQYGLNIDSPWSPSTVSSLQAWVDWWTLSLELAKTLSEDEKATRWSAGDWPPQTPTQVGLPPDVVTLTLRKDDQHCQRVRADYLERHRVASEARQALWLATSQIAIALNILPPAPGASDMDLQRWVDEGRQSF